MKLIVQIPCYNEEATLPQTFADIPKEIEGIDQVEVLIIDDGSTDRTVEVARDLGIDYIVINKKNLGLARAFSVGIDACLKYGADIIVNTDGDNQYAGSDIPILIGPILTGKADLVIGDRQTDRIADFSYGKKKLQKIGSVVVRQLSGVDVPDAVSGFRAFTKDVALRLNILSSFSYTTEMLIQAGKKNMKVASVPVSVNAKTRESRLFKNLTTFISQTAITMVRVYAMYQPLRVFFCIGSLLTLIGLIPVIRFLIYYFMDSGLGHIQSLTLGGVFLVIGFLTFMIGLVADLISQNRQLTELMLEKVRKIELAEYKAKENVD